MRTTTATKLMLESLVTTGSSLAPARGANRCPAMPSSSGASISTTSGAAIPQGSTAKPFTKSGSASGMATTLPAISRTIKAVAVGTFVRPIAATLGRNGAPAANPSSSSPSS